MPSDRRIVAVVTDLMFMVKIETAAKQANVDVVFVKSHKDALASARSHPEMLILDLNISSVDVLKLISELKDNLETRDIRLLGYVSHVQTGLIKAAQASGCDTVMARSSFSQKLPEIIRPFT